MSFEERRRNRRGQGVKNREWTMPGGKSDGMQRNRRGRVIGVTKSRAEPSPTTQTSENIIQYKGKAYTEEEFKKQFGSLFLLALSEQKELGREGRGADIRGGGGYKDDEIRFTAPTVPDIDGSDDRTQTSPNRGDKPTNWEQYEQWLKGEQFEGTPYSAPNKAAEQQAYNFYQPRQGQQSGALPGTAATKPEPIIEAEEPQLEGLSARSRAFLDAPMGEGPMALLRRADAAQGILRTEGKIAVNMGDGTYQEITEEGYRDAIDNMRDKGGAELGQDFFNKYKIEVEKKMAATPTDKNNPDIDNPMPATMETPFQTMLKTSTGTPAITSSFNNTDDTLLVDKNVDLELDTNYMRFGEDPEVTGALFKLNPELRDALKRAGALEPELTNYNYTDGHYQY